MPVAAPKGLDAPFGFLYPTRSRSGAAYDSARAYTIKDAQGTRHAARRTAARDCRPSAVRVRESDRGCDNSLHTPDAPARRLRG